MPGSGWPDRPTGPSLPWNMHAVAVCNSLDKSPEVHAEWNQGISGYLVYGAFKKTKG